MSEKDTIYYACPFCGAEPELLLGGATVECSDCGASAPAASWNCRDTAKMTKLKQEEDELNER